ncbi:MAG: LuxR C-terminal-related transcriptional regulator [Rhodocyclaceae bacterium]|nr:LuxR C-terminal-related transcriptional regulator [Rhodocyclaceae bacterium]MDZ4214004.1 XrtB/PEP-CTERM-associated transcriptional regulator EpsA [Rhodocyclaceae bacterium]
MYPNTHETVVDYPPVALPLEMKPIPVLAPVPLLPGAMDMESVALNLEASLRIYTHHHLFGWTQGLLQNLIRHEVLICSLRKGASELSLIEGFSTAHRDPKHFSQLYRQDVVCTETLVKKWTANDFKPIVFAVADETGVAESPLMRDFVRIGASRIIAHGTHDASARMVSFFVFACRDGDADPADLLQVEMLVPFLHTAWMRTQVGLATNSGESPSHPEGRDLLTRREQEVLKWVYLGKSNIEIGIILGISPLTVKNHVQEILRRLDVQNRTQAVGKAFNLRILTC